MKLSERIEQAILDDFGWASDAAAMEDQLDAVKAALREYHCGRDRSLGARMGMFRLSRSIETIFETPYVPGEPSERKKETELK